MKSVRKALIKGALSAALAGVFAVAGSSAFALGEPIFQVQEGVVPGSAPNLIFPKRTPAAARGILSTTTLSPNQAFSGPAASLTARLLPRNSLTGLERAATTFMACSRSEAPRLLSSHPREAIRLSRLPLLQARFGSLLIRYRTRPWLRR